MATARLLSFLVVFITCAGGSAAWSQEVPALPRAMGVQASLGDGWMSGVVTDEAGLAVRGARVLAAGAVVAMATTDHHGRFTLILPTGDYLVRASRPGFVSTYREPVRVQPNRGIERRILLVRQAAADVQQPVQPQEDDAPIEDERHRHSEMAWRLRHLKRTVLRTVAPGSVLDQEPTPAMPGLQMSGYVNLLTAGSVGDVGTDGMASGSHGIANVFVEAPVGHTGQWSLRAAMAGGAQSSSWALRGEYGTRTVDRHDVRLAVSYSKHGFGPTDPSAVTTSLDERRAGSLDVEDRWVVRPALALDYGVRLDHHDYLQDSALASPRVAVRYLARPGTALRASAEQRAVAPGAHDFRDPSSSGLWLPAVHTYTLSPTANVEPQRTRRYVVGVEQALGASEMATVSVLWLSEQTDNQMGTMFGLDGEGGRYDLITLGDASLDGWRVVLDGPVARNITGRLQYTEARVRWSRGRSAVAPVEDLPLARTGPENLSDLRASLDLTVPLTSTRFILAYQVTRLDPVRASNALPTLVDNGFDVEIRQPLPDGLFDSRPVHLLLSVSTMFHESGADPLLDEALTVRAPARVTAGIQVGF